MQASTKLATLLRLPLVSESENWGDPPGVGTRLLRGCDDVMIKTKKNPSNWRQNQKQTPEAKLTNPNKSHAKFLNRSKNKSDVILVRAEY